MNQLLYWLVCLLVSIGYAPVEISNQTFSYYYVQPIDKVLFNHSKHNKIPNEMLLTWKKIAARKIVSGIILDKPYNSPSFPLFLKFQWITIYEKI